MSDFSEIFLITLYKFKVKMFNMNFNTNVYHTFWRITLEINKN